MRADLEAELNRLRDDADRVGMLASVLVLLCEEPTLAAAGGIDGLRSPVASQPLSTGVGDAGTRVAEIAAHLDSGELYTGVALSARTALSLHEAHVEWAPGINDLEDEHGLDAITRLVGLGLVAEGLCDGDSDAAASAWLDTESGRAALAWFSAVEVVLAFGTSEDPVDGDKVIALLDAFFDDAIEAWSELASERALARARIIVNNWTDFLCPIVAASAGSVSQIADALGVSIGMQVDGGIDELKSEAIRLGVYLGLVSRHIAESINGLSPVGAEAQAQPVSEGVQASDTKVETSDPAKVNGRQLGDELAIARGEYSALTERVATAHASLESSKQALSKCEESSERMVVEHSRLAAALLAARETSADAASLGEGDANRVSSARRKAESGQESVDAAIAEQVLAEGRLVERVEALQACTRARDEAVEHFQRSLENELSGWQMVTKIQHRMVSLQGGSAGDTFRLMAIDERRSVSTTRRSQLKAELSALRTRRRASSKAQQSVAASLEVIKEQREELQVQIDREALAKEIAKTDLKARIKRVKADQAKQTKRQRRVEELEDRQAGGDTLVAEISDCISDTRAQLERVLSSLQEGQKQQEELRKARRKTLRKDLIVAQRALSKDQEAMAPLMEDAETLSASLDLKSTEFERVHGLRDETRAMLRMVTAEHKQLTSSKLKSRKLAEAALGMLRNNARRLEEAHQGLHEAQAAADTLRKEHNLATGRLERLVAEVEIAQRRELDAAQAIEGLQRTIEQAHSALERHAAKIERSRVRLTKDRAERARLLTSQVELKHAEIRAFQVSIADAKEDREGLAVAEVRIDQAAATHRERRERAVERQRVLKVRHDAAAGRSGKRDEQLRTLGLRIKAMQKETEGLALTLQGVMADHRSRQLKVTNSEGRLPHLDAAIGRARQREDDEVERVADFQSWVERTQASIEKLEKSQPTAPKSQARKNAVSKVDRLLANLKQPPSEHIPDPSAVPEVDGEATVMVNVAALTGGQGSQGQATQILPRGAAEEEPEAATEMFSPADLLERLAEEGDHDATVMMPRTQRRPPRTRSEDEDG